MTTRNHRRAPSGGRYIFWDWNGTLLDDTDMAIETLNIMISRRGGKRISKEFYRDNFAFPVRPFYERIGVVLKNEDWDALAREYHDTYSAMPKHLAADALDALEAVRKAGAGQSIISALRQDLLERDTSAAGVASFMDWIFGVDNLDGTSKTKRAEELARLVAEERGGLEGCVLIGDSLHDAETAAAMGVRCILYAGGSHSAKRLAAAGPTADTLMEAVGLSLGL